MVDGEVAAGASAAGHDFVGDGEHAVFAAELCDLFQISGRRGDGKGWHVVAIASSGAGAHSMIVSVDNA